MVNAFSLGIGLASGSLLADVLVARSGPLASVGIMLAIGSALAGHAPQMRWPKCSFEVKSLRRPSDSCCAKVTLNPHTQKLAYAALKFSPRSVGHPPTQILSASLSAIRHSLNKRIQLGSRLHFLEKRRVTERQERGSCYVQGKRCHEADRMPWYKERSGKERHRRVDYGRCCRHCG